MQPEIETLKINKSQSDRLMELADGLMIIKDSLGGIESGKSYQIVPLYGQLRSLLDLRTNRGRTTNHPLLLELASDFGLNSDVYSIPDQDDEIPELSLNDGIMVASDVSVDQIFKTQVKTTIDEYLDKDVVNFQGRKFTARKIIAEYADKAGGAHYDPDIDPYLWALKNSGLLNGFSYKLGKVAQDLGCKILQNTTNFTIFAHICLPEQDLSKGIILFDYKHMTTSMRITISLNNVGNIVFSVVDHLNRSWGVVGRKLNNFKELYTVQVDLALSSNLTTTLSIKINGEDDSEMTFAEPIHILNNVIEYSKYYNLSHESTNGGYFGVGEIVIFGDMPYLDKSRMVAYMEQEREKLINKESPLIWFNQGSFGHSEPGSNDIIMTGKVTTADISKGQY